MALARRTVLGAAAAAGMGYEVRMRARDVKIRRVEAIPIRYPVEGRFKFFEGGHGRPSGRQAVLVKITADNGAVGWGQSVPIPRWSYETIETVTSTIRRYLGPELIGLDPFDEERITAALSAAIAPSFSTGQPICKAGIELALFDLTGRMLGKNAAERWGLTGRDSLTLSWTLNPRTLDEVPYLIEAGRSRGYRNFNVKVAPDLDFDVALCRQVKRLVPEGFLWADANGGYDLDTAPQAARKLADAGVAVLEQPLPANRLDGYRQLTRLKALPVLMDEGIVSHVELEEFIRLGMLDGVAVKPARCGGITETRRQIDTARRHGLMVLGSGLTDPDISLAASLAVFGACGIETPCALNGPQFLRGTVLTHPLEPSTGEIAVPSGAGLGVEVDEKKIGRLLARDVA